MKNVILTRTDAMFLAHDRWRLLAAGAEILLRTGAQLAPLADGTYLLKGYAADGSDVDTLLGTPSRAIMLRGAHQ